MLELVMAAVLAQWIPAQDAATVLIGQEPPSPSAASRSWLAGFVAQDAGECDLKKVVEMWECRKCDAFLDRVDKEGRCPACKQKAEKVKVCEKLYYVALCCKTRHAAKGKC